MISRINPFFILGILALLLALLFFGVKSRESKIQKGNIELAKYEAKAKMLQELQRGWNQKNITSKLNSLAQSAMLKSNSKYTKTNDRAIMSISKVDKSQADNIVKNIFNEPFEIKKFNIKRATEHLLEIHLEVAQ